MNKLSIEEKIRLLMGKNAWNFYDANGKLPLITLSDASMGLRRYNAETKSFYPSIAYPCEQMLANSWDLDLIYQMARAVANDAKEFGVDVLLGPGVNIKRLPTNGRNFEYFSEDPLLSGLMGKAYIEGIQIENIGACLKHYACNNTEISRKWTNMIVDERTLNEIYLKPFKIACEAKPWTLMTAYNLVNGKRMSAHKDLNDKLRNEFNFDGLILSDWNATQDLNDSMLSGLDITMPYEERLINPVLEMAQKGQLNLKVLDDRTNHIIKNIEKINASKKLRKITMTKEERHSLCQKIEEESIVLLKNKDNILPLRKEQKVLVTGAPTFQYCYGGGSSEVKPSKPFKWLGVAMKELGGLTLLSESVWNTTGEQANMGNMVDTCEKAKIVDAVVLGVGNDHLTEGESRNRQHIKLSKEQVNAIKYISRFAKKLIVVVYAGSAIDMNGWVDMADAIVWAGFGGQYVSEALAKVLYGEVNPSGKLSETFPRKLEDVPSENAFVDYDRNVYEERINVGYRYFVSNSDKVLFPFGHGLSYSKFEYKDLKVIEEKDCFNISFTLINTSNIDGKEVIQIYSGCKDKTHNFPLRELRAFKKVFVKANTEEKVEIKLMKKELMHYSIELHSWIEDCGELSIEVASSSLDIKLEKRLKYGD